MKKKIYCFQFETNSNAVLVLSLASSIFETFKP